MSAKLQDNCARFSFSAEALLSYLRDSDLAELPIKMPPFFFFPAQSNMSPERIRRKTRSAERSRNRSISYYIVHARTRFVKARHEKRLKAIIYLVVLDSIVPTSYMNSDFFHRLFATEPTKISSHRRKRRWLELNQTCLHSPDWSQASKQTQQQNSNLEKKQTKKRT